MHWQRVELLRLLDRLRLLWLVPHEVEGIASSVLLERREDVLAILCLHLLGGRCLEALLLLLRFLSLLAFLDLQLRELSLTAVFGQLLLGLRHHGVVSPEKHLDALLVRLKEPCLFEVELKFLLFGHFELVNMANS